MVGNHESPNNRHDVLDLPAKVKSALGHRVGPEHRMVVDQTHFRRASGGHDVMTSNIVTANAQWSRLTGVIDFEIERQVSVVGYCPEQAHEPILLKGKRVGQLPKSRQYGCNVTAICL